MVVDLDIDELLAAGLSLAPEQIDYYLHPERCAYAVAVFGLPHPDYFMQGGPEEFKTLYQIAAPGEPCTPDGLQACVLPVAIKATDPDKGLAQIAEYHGEPELHFPFVVGEIEDNDWTWRWFGEDIPTVVAAWDLWPISEDDVYVYARATREAFNSSRMEEAWEIADLTQSGEPISTALIEDTKELYEQSRNPIERQELLDLISQLEQEEYERLEKSVIHPIEGVADAQVPPVLLPPEQDALWTSLQQLSQYNWWTLQQLHDPDADPHGGEFVNANRRLCPWY